MAKDIILKIKAAEAEAQKIRADAENTVKERVRNAHEMGKILCENAEEEATRVNAEKLKLTSRKADELLENSRKVAEEEANAVADACMSHMEEAVRVIIEGVFEECR